MRLLKLLTPLLFLVLASCADDGSSETVKSSQTLQALEQKVEPELVLLVSDIQTKYARYGGRSLSINKEIYFLGNEEFAPLVTYSSHAACDNEGNIAIHHGTFLMLNNDQGDNRKRLEALIMRAIGDCQLGRDVYSRPSLDASGEVPNSIMESDDRRLVNALPYDEEYFYRELAMGAE